MMKKVENVIFPLLCIELDLKNLCICDEKEKSIEMYHNGKSNGNAIIWSTS